MEEEIRWDDRKATIMNKFVQEILSDAAERMALVEKEMRVVVAFLALCQKMLQEDCKPDQPRQMALHKGKSNGAKKYIGRPKEIADLCETILREAGKPLNSGEIVEALNQRGCPILSISVKPTNYICTLFNRYNNRFKLIKGEGYTLNTEKYREVKVNP